MTTTQEKRTEAVQKLTDAIDQALDDAPVQDVLHVLVGVFVGLTVELARRRGHDVSEPLEVSGLHDRDITIHASKN